MGFFCVGGGGRWSCHKERANLVNFYGILSCENFQNFFVAFFSRTLAFVFTYGFLKKFSRTHFFFHGHFLRNFHGRKKIFTDGKPKIVKNFHGRDFDFHGEKKKHWVWMGDFFCL